MNWIVALPGKLIDMFRGRTTLFAGLFFVSGNAMHLLHRLDATYIGFMTALMGFVLGHSVKESFAPADKPDLVIDDAKPEPEK